MVLTQIVKQFGLVRTSSVIVVEHFLLIFLPKMAKILIIIR
jgi:hypothetical protein